MLNGLRTFLHKSASNDADLTRRRYPRRETDRCVLLIEGRAFPVENWSFGGALFAGDDRVFSTDENVTITLKFRLNSGLLEVPQKGRVVRKGNQKIAVRFESITRTVARNLQQVIDDAVAREFAQSQV